MRKQLEVIEDLTNTLISCAQEVEQSMHSGSILGGTDGPASPPDDVEKRFDELLKAKDAHSRIRSMKDPIVVHLAGYAARRMESELMDGQLEVQADLDVSFGWSKLTIGSLSATTGARFPVDTFGRRAAGAEGAGQGGAAECMGGQSFRRHATRGQAVLGGFS
jgi:hypothetical protein